ncbi:MAG TPA: hypothetical protein VGP44_07045 [Gemmatimonadales bacterium]|nr:hypothetical protein [Gemmatimonadales bacterium]
MARNLSRKFATMSEEERARFELEEIEGTKDRPVELDFEEPRDPERMGAHYANPKDETADPGHRDGMAALLDDEAHERAVRKESRKTRPGERKPESDG